MPEKTTLICLLDKEYPPDHSFVTGMLADVLPREGGIRVQLLVGTPKKGPLKPVRYHHTECMPVLPGLPRKGFQRVRAAVSAYKHTRKLIDQAHQRGEKAVLFVRNDPLMLMVASLLRSKTGRLLFQSSFPFEEVHDSSMKRKIHRTFYKIAGRNVDGLLAVSPLGLERVKKLLPKVGDGLSIPLLADLQKSATNPVESKNDIHEPIRFIYVGTHRTRRRLDVVLRGITASLDDGVNAQFVFVGGKPEEIQELRKVPGVYRWEKKGRIEFLGPVPRPELMELLKEYDVGVSIIPGLNIYKEASPTKTVEYMGAGLAVLASCEVSLQEEFVRRSGAGQLVHFDPESIRIGINNLAGSPEKLLTLKKQAQKFARDELQYGNYLKSFCDLIIGSDKN